MSWSWLARINKRLWFALVVSALLHFFLLAESEGWLPSWMPDDEPLEVTLAAIPPPVAKPVSQNIPVEPKPRHIQKAEQAPKTTPPPTPIEPSIESAEQPVSPPVQTAPEPAPEPTPVQTAGNEEKPPIANDEPVAATEPETPAGPPPPKHVELEFLVDYNGATAVERQDYQAFDDGHYVVSSIAQAKGLLSLAFSDLNQKSSGQLTAQGLRPDVYTYQYGSNSKKAQKASFDWTGKMLTMEVGDRKQTAPLDDGTQDMLSFLYQFMFTPPLQQFQLTITNGKQLKLYRYLFDGEEEIKTKLGTLRALHISKSSGTDNQKTELWLAEDYHYLPVKIRKTDSDGKVIQNTINSIKMDGTP
jgi:Protein of unknown function (DUF3108)